MIKHNGSHSISLYSVLLAAIAVLFALSVTLAWFAGRKNTGESERRDIDKPPLLYLLDSDATDAIALDLSGLTAGVDKEYVICVSAIAPGLINLDDNKEDLNSHNAINLELAYTPNLPVDYSLTPIEYLGDTLTDDSPATAFPFTSQQGTTLYYDRAKNTALEQSGDLVTDDIDTGVTYRYFKPIQFSHDYHFFVLDITWQKGYDKTFFLKETDVIYIIAKSGYFSTGTETTEVQE